jgi:hypothetical protein
MNLPLGSRVVIDRTNEPNHAPGELVLLVEAPGLEVQTTCDSLTDQFIVHASVIRGARHSFTFCNCRVPTINGAKAMTVSLIRNGPK